MTVTLRIMLAWQCKSSCWWRLHFCYHCCILCQFVYQEVAFNSVQLNQRSLYLSIHYNYQFNLYQIIILYAAYPAGLVLFNGLDYWTELPATKHNHLKPSLELLKYFYNHQNNYEQHLTHVQCGWKEGHQDLPPSMHCIIHKMLFYCSKRQSKQIQIRNTRI